MPLSLKQTAHETALVPAPVARGSIARSAPRPAPVTEIALINNMPDAAFEATEQQFSRLLADAAGGGAVRLHVFALPSVKRSAATQARIDVHYDPIEALRDMAIDGLIVTGAEPKAASLRDEDYWDELTGIIDWARDNTRTALFSCLAAHAAVLHLDNVQRRPLGEKRFGFFECAAQRDHWLVDDVAQPLTVAHSRLNEVAAQDLAAAGYSIVTQSAEAGADIFAKNFGSEFVFFQGHPEYDAQSLRREFVRDVNRFASGVRPALPGTPVHYFDEATEGRIAAFRGGALGTFKTEALFSGGTLQLRPGVAARSRATAASVFGNWLRHLSDDR